MTMRNTLAAIVGAAATLAPGLARAAFPPPAQADPANQFTAAFGVDYQNVLTYTRTLGLDENFDRQPDLYWFKYTSNGRTALKLDTLGSNFGTAGGGPVLGIRNDSVVAVYNASGQKKGIAHWTQNSAGDPIPLYPTYTSDPTQWYVPQGLSEAYFAPGQQTRNPHWDVDPENPTGFTGWAAPGNEGNSQKYFPPHYPTTLNEYHVWSTALSPIMLDMDENPVINPSTGQPRPQPGWRYFDRARHGPGAPWSRFEQLAAGDYYIAIASAGVTFAGDNSIEEVLQAPIHFDYTTLTENNTKLSGPLGTFQYYTDMGSAASQSSLQYGQISLNVTQTPAPATLVWVGSQAAGAWDVQTTFNWQNGVLSDQFYAGDYVKFDNSSGQTSVNLTTALTPGGVIVDSSQNYTFTGGGAIGGAGALTKSGTGKLTLSNTSANTYAGGTNVLGGTLEVSNNSSIGAGPLTVGGGTFRLLSGRTNAVHVDTVDVAGTGAVDLTDATLVIDDSPGSSLNDIRQAIESGYAGGAWTGPGIRSSLANANQYGVGYQDDGSTITLKRARFGDANLSGNVNSDDFNLLASSFGTSGKFWQNGDFNYSGVVNSDDFNLLAGNFGLSAGADGIVDPEDWAALAAAVPEPTACVIFGGIATSLGMFRRRGH